MTEDDIVPVIDDRHPRRPEVAEVDWQARQEALDVLTRHLQELDKEEIKIKTLHAYEVPYHVH